MSKEKIYFLTVKDWSNMQIIARELKACKHMFLEGKDPKKIGDRLENLAEELSAMIHKFKHTNDETPFNLEDYPEYSLSDEEIDKFTSYYQHSPEKEKRKNLVTIEYHHYILEAAASTFDYLNIKM